MDPFAQDFVIKGGEIRLGKKLTKELLDEYKQQSLDYGNVTSDYPTANPFHLITAAIFNLFQAESKLFYQNKKIDLSSIPIHGRYVGGNYSAGRKLKQGEKLTKSDISVPPIDTIDSYAKSHDIAYNLALGLSDPDKRKKLISKADQVFIFKTQATKINKLKLSLEIIATILSAYGFYKTFTSVLNELNVAQARFDEVLRRQEISEALPIQQYFEMRNELARIIDLLYDDYDEILEDLEIDRYLSHITQEEYNQKVTIINEAFQSLVADAKAPIAELQSIAADNAMQVARLNQELKLNASELSSLKTKLIQWSAITGVAAGSLAERTYNSLLESASSAVFSYFLSNEELRPNFSKLDLTLEDIKMYLHELKNSNNPLDQIFIDAFISEYENEINPPAITLPNLPVLSQELPPQVLAALIALF